MDGRRECRTSSSNLLLLGEGLLNEIGPELAADLFVFPDEGIKKLHMKKILILQPRLHFNILVNLLLFNL